MKILFDQGVPVPLRQYLQPHAVDTAAERGWSHLSNGELLRAIESAGYDAFITTDQNLRYQQVLTGHSLGIVVLMSTSWPRLQRVIPEIQTALTQVVAGGYAEVFLS